MPQAYEVRELDKSEYTLWDNFVDMSPQGTIYNKSWWLETVSPGFRILVCEDGSGIIGGMALPWVRGKIYKNPKLTPALGILFKDFKDMKPVNRISKEVGIISSLIDKLPGFILFDYAFSENFINFLPFKWKNFKFDIEYTYILKDLGNTDSLLRSFRDSVREKIRKAERLGIKIRDDLTIDEFYQLDRGTYTRQGFNIGYSKEFLLRLDNMLKEKDSRKILFAVDAQDNILGANYLAYDNRSVHGVAMSSNDEGKKAGVPSLLVWEAIKFASEVSKECNFEGSSLEPIEYFLRGFGGQLVPRLRISKCNPIVGVLLDTVKNQKILLRKLDYCLRKKE